ncbi:MAG TPA: VIT domain-containing protein [Kofleriaceae bacterium]|nr:VIT domain-containing protein [Kofleriaceae bacterium]
MARTPSWLVLCFAACATPGTDSPARAPTGAASTTTTATSFAQAGAPSALIAATSGAALIAEEGPPISLTASDGTGLVLTKLEAKAVVEGPLALTELHLRFQNPQDRVLEGRFAITLPDGAALSRFAMHQDKGWMEAEVVERMAARRAYEDFLHRRQDPALLENEAGNEFSARVFPIPARGTKELIVTFSHEVKGTYTLPLRGLPQIGEVNASVKVARPDRATPAYDETTLTQAAWQPDRDFTVSLGAAPRAIRAGDLVAMMVDPLADAAPAAMPGVTILFDTSASRAPGFAGQVENLVAMVGELGRAHGATLPVTIAAFDQSVEEVYRGPASGVLAARDALLARRALGASDTAAALRWAAAHAPAKRLVVIGDGVATVGEEAAVGEALGALKASIERLDVVLVGGIRDRDAASRLARGTFEQDGAVLDGARGPAEVARRLGLATRSGLKVQIAGARWVWPQTLDGVQPGDTQVVIAQLASAGARRAPRVDVKAGDATTTFAPATVPLPLLARAAAGAEIARLESQRATATDAKQKDALAKQIIALSTRNRVLSDLTALLVLETEDDYKRFDIPRTALVDILVVGKGGIELQHRGDIVLMAQPEPAKTEPVTGAKAGKEDKAEKKKVYDFDSDVVEGDLVRPDGETISVRGYQSADRPADQVRVSNLETLSVEEERPSPGAADVAPRSMRPPAEPPAPPPPPPSPSRRPRPSGAGGDDLDGRTAGVVGNIAADPAPDATSDEEPKQPETPALEGELAVVMALIKAGKTDDALTRALAWRDKDAGDVLALVALGEALEAKKMPALAARAYGSIIDLFPSRADLRRFAGERLERLGDTSRMLAVDTYRQAVESRPDHLTGHRLLAMALVRAGDLPGAFAALEHGLTQRYPDDRFRGGTRILAEDLGMVAAAWIAKAPGERRAIEARLAKHGVKVAREASLRFVLYWETDANDVDFHIRDAKGGHAFYKSKSLRSGGELYEDVTTGYGPENFTIPGGGGAAPYDLQIHYYSRGPMGYGMGMLEILRHDGKGKLSFEHRPYIVMVDGAFVNLGTIDGKTASAVIAR